MEQSPIQSWSAHRDEGKAGEVCLEIIRDLEVGKPAPFTIEFWKDLGNLLEELRDKKC